MKTYYYNLKSNYIILFMLCLVIILLTSCTKEQDSKTQNLVKTKIEDVSGWKTFRVDRYKFELEYPPNWIANFSEGGDYGDYIFCDHILSPQNITGRCFSISYVEKDNRFMTSFVGGKTNRTTIQGYETLIKEGEPGLPEFNIISANIKRKSDGLDIGYFNVQESNFIISDEDRDLFGKFLTTIKFDEVNEEVLNKKVDCSAALSSEEINKIKDVCVSDINNRLNSINKKINENKNQTIYNNLILQEYKIFNDKECGTSDYIKQWDINQYLGSPAQSTSVDLYKSSGAIYIGVIKFEGNYAASRNQFTFKIPFYCNKDGLLQVSDEILSQLEGKEYVIKAKLSQDSIILQGRVIDIYPNSYVLTIETTKGNEEIIQFDKESKIIIDKLRQNSEVEIRAKSTEDGLYLGNNIEVLSPSALTFDKDISQINLRKSSAPTFPVDSLILPPFYKPASFILINPEGKILSPNFKSLQDGYYTKEKVWDEIKHTIEIPWPIEGMWGIKVVPEQDADRSTTLYISYIIDPAKTLGELEGKIVYFKVPKGER